MTIQQQQCTETGVGFSTFAEVRRLHDYSVHVASSSWNAARRFPELRLVDGLFVVRNTVAQKYEQAIQRVNTDPNQELLLPVSMLADMAQPDAMHYVLGLGKIGKQFLGCVVEFVDQQFEIK